MVPFKINQNSHVPLYRATLIDGSGSPADLTGMTVTFKLRRYGDTALKVDAAATIVSAATGEVQYSWTGTDTDTLGMYLAWWEATDGTDVYVYPSDQVDLIEIITGPNLGYTLLGACAPWTSINEVRATCGSSALTGDANYVSDDLIQVEINVATDLLYTLTGQQFSGECVMTIRPCQYPTCFGADETSSIPMPLDHSAMPYRQCTCGRLSRVDLGYWPVTNIIYVRVDGDIVDPTEYRLDSNRWLTHVGEEIDDIWPRCQHLALPTTEIGTWEVMFEYGMAPPPSGREAAARLACELIKANQGGTCQLSARVNSVNRQQMNFTMMNASMLQNGLTGIWDVDLFVQTYNPNKARGGTVVWSPDLQPSPYRAG